MTCPMASNSSSNPEPTSVTSAKRNVFVKVLSTNGNSLMSVFEDADFYELQGMVIHSLGLSEKEFAKLWRLEWEDMDGDRMRLRDQFDWAQALEYHRQTTPRSPIKLFLAPATATIVSEQWNTRSSRGSRDSRDSPSPNGSSQGSPLLRPQRPPITFTTSSSEESPLQSQVHGDLSRCPSTDLVIGLDKITYSKGRILGSGSFGTVYLGLNQRTGQMVAIKEVSLPSQGGSITNTRLKALAHEIRMLERLQHPNIVRYYGMQRLPHGFAIIMEYIPGGSIACLLRQFGPFSEELICTYITQTLLGLDYLHHEDILHRDIKGGNILVSDKGEIRLADFGSSKALHEVLVSATSKHSIVGTIEWMAPEMITGNSVSKAADIWSLGCVMLEMLYAGSPWSRNDFKFSGLSAMYYIGANPAAVPHIPSDLLSPEACNFLDQCLQRNPDARATTEELLKHQWITGEAFPTENWAHCQADAILKYIQESVKSHNFNDGLELPTSKHDLVSEHQYRSPSPCPEERPPPKPTYLENLNPSTLEALQHGLLDMARQSKECLEELHSPDTPDLKLAAVMQRGRATGALAHSPVPLDHPDQHLEALLQEIPDPTHRELGLFRILTARVERTEERLRQRLDILEQLAASFIQTEHGRPSTIATGLPHGERSIAQGVHPSSNALVRFSDRTQANAHLTELNTQQSTPELHQSLVPLLNGAWINGCGPGDGGLQEVGAVSNCEQSRCQPTSNGSHTSQLGHLDTSIAKDVGKRNIERQQLRRELFAVQRTFVLLAQLLWCTTAWGLWLWVSWTMSPGGTTTS